MASYDRTRIQNALVDAALAGIFYPVIYDKTTHEASVDEANPVVPASALANEVAATFDEAALNRMYGQDERESWTYQLRLKFKGEVLLEVFEKDLTENRIRLPRDDASGLRQVTLRLEGSDPTHPVQQEPATGTQVVYTFEANLSPA